MHGAALSLRRADQHQAPTLATRTFAPAVRGAITTLFREGKLKRKCSVCKESPFTCPVFHSTDT